MKNVSVNGHEYDIRLFVFDKDGLMFESHRFWIELAQSRVRAVQKKYPEIPEKVIEDWMTYVGAQWEKDPNGITVTGMDPMGILAIAPVPEELICSAGYFSDHLKMDWLTSRKMTRDIFETGDELFELEKALNPRPGFPDILKRLRKAGIPYGVATSDTKERVKISLDLYDKYENAAFAVTLDDVEKGKPNPDMLYLIQKNTGIPMEHIAMLGDSYVDVAMAKAASAIGIGIPEQESMRQKMTGVATEIVDSLEEILIKEDGQNA